MFEHILRSWIWKSIIDRYNIKCSTITAKTPWTIFLFNYNKTCYEKGLVLDIIISNFNKSWNCFSILAYFPYKKKRFISFTYFVLVGAIIFGSENLHAKFFLHQCTIIQQVMRQEDFRACLFIYTRQLFSFYFFIF